MSSARSHPRSTSHRERRHSKRWTIKLPVPLGCLLLYILALSLPGAGATIRTPPIRSLTSIKTSPGPPVRQLPAGGGSGHRPTNSDPRDQRSRPVRAATLDSPTNANGYGDAAKPRPDLRHRSVYQVLTDRFALDLGLNADGSERMVRCDPDERKYCGGTWKGIERRLEYIQNMGFDTGASISPCGPRLGRVLDARGKRSGL